MRRTPWEIPTVGGEASQLRQCDKVSNNFLYQPFINLVSIHSEAKEGEVGTEGVVGEDESEGGGKSLCSMH